MSANRLGPSCLAKVEVKINRHSFYTWFKPTSFVADDGHALTIRVPNPLFKDWLTKHYAVVLSEALRESGRADAVLTFQAAGSEPAEATHESADDTAVVEAAPVTAQGLNQRYTFDTFVVGPSNQFAHAACRAVAERRRSPTTRSSSTAASVSARRT